MYNLFKEYTNKPVDYPFKNVYITHSGIALKGLCILKNSVFKNVSTWIFYKYAIYKRVTEPKIQIEEKNCLIIHNHWSSGYHHWVTEALTRLLVVDHKSYNLIIPEDYPEFALDSLHYFDFNSIIRLPAQTGCFVKDVVIPPNPASGHYNSHTLLQLKTVLTQNLKPTINNRNKKIYVSRKNAKVRKIENETDVINLLQDNGYEILYAEELSFKQQIEIFSQCTDLISIHGAALTNCLFMPEGSNVIELYREPQANLPEMNYCYQRQTAALGLNHHYIFCKTGENLGTHIDKINLNVNLQQLQEAILK